MLLHYGVSTFRNKAGKHEIFLQVQMDHSGTKPKACDVRVRFDPLLQHSKVQIYKEKYINSAYSLFLIFPSFKRNPREGINYWNMLTA